MASMLDMVGSAIIFGILILTVARVQENLNSTMYQNTFNTQTQQLAINIARQMEYDFTKIGYRIPMTSQKIFHADSTKIAFKGSLTYGGTVDSIVYELGEPDTTSQNPRDYRLLRTTNSGTISQRIGVVDFRLSYFDTTNTAMTLPINTVAAFNAIRSVNVRVRFESLEPVQQAFQDSATYFGVNWEKLIYARNLGGLNLR